MINIYSEYPATKNIYESQAKQTQRGNRKEKKKSMFQNNLIENFKNAG